jgi:hypothetical protein
MRPLAATGALLLVFAACGSSGSSSKSTTTTSAGAPSSSSSSSTVTTTQAATGGSTTPVSVAPTHPTAHLVAVRAARQESVDRVVFEFTEQVPGYKVSYEKKPLRGTSGAEVPLAGSEALVVRMQAASGFNLDTGQPTYSGAKQVRPSGTRAVQEATPVDDFEGVLIWGIGLNAHVPFRVSTLTSPPRLVIDLPS